MQVSFRSFYLCFHCRKIWDIFNGKWLHLCCFTGFSNHSKSFTTHSIFTSAMQSATCSSEVMQHLLTKAAHSISLLSLHTSTHILTSFGSNLGFSMLPKDTLTCSHSCQPSKKWTSCSTMSKMDAFYVIGQVDFGF